MGMCKAYVSSTKDHVHSVDQKICFDRFHVSKIFGGTFNRVRRQEYKMLIAVGDPSLTSIYHLLLKRGDIRSLNE